MASGNMILTLVARTKGFSKNLQDAGRKASGFGKVVGVGIGLAISAIAALGTAIITVIPNLVGMAEAARKSELRLGNIAKQMGLFGENTQIVTSRVSKYAETLSYATGVDDDLIKSAEGILLTFKEVAKSADVAGGAFDRATQATIDLAAAGFGNAEDNAKQLGKALNDPIKGLTSLTKAGVTFTKKERDKIKKLTESGKLLEAQNIILTAIETQVGGTAEATASAADKMNAKWEAVQEQLGTALLPTVDKLADSFGKWLESADGKKTIGDLTKAVEDFGTWITSPDGKQAIDNLTRSLKLMFDTVTNLVTMVNNLAEAWSFASDQARNYNSRFYSPNAPRSPGQNNVNPGSGNSSAPGGPPRSAGAAPVTVNVNGITPSVTVGRTVLNAIKNAQKVGIR